ncbi:hypothetical protein AB0J72_37855 [Dactylosporangium sp. NPDC049742]|uniref:hypothetical protein n=1 Tax=Dactylosporangium sp. NPDC049742 TaxID=3154737 RepID=UPI00341EDBEB
MIVGSLLLIVVAVGLLVVGLLQGADALLVASIGASLLAAVALIVGGRQAAAARSSRTVRTGRQVPNDERYDPFESRLDADSAREARQPVGAGARSTGGTTYGRGAGSGSGPGSGPGAGSGAPARLADSGRTDANLSPVDETAITPPVRDEPVVPQQPYDDYPASADGDWSVDGEEFDDEDPEDEPPIQPSSPADMARVATMQDEVLVIDGRPRYHVRGCVHLLGRESEPLPISEAVELGFTPCSVCEPNDAVLAGRA